ncbi:hypothetical protein EGI16_06190 [Chryseobacterium sp. G0240]|uniref:hypothetical protein n=1 Tax=Chryseobacterium sp. G0240 TaxID=2487066 RepID=UPI000F449D1B|nr:hypothetical protein [Chryseobacterium sp. G0240]ROI05967.1 hypothetical protein EGI16_06190 [Chryseobacterium sp. G0240]
MKKNIFKILGLAIVLSFTNCSNDGTLNQENLSAETSVNSGELKSKLSSFNENFVYKTNNNLTGKKWWQTALQIAAIATGDASGAAAGVWAVQGLAGAVGAATAGTGYAVVSTAAGIIGAAGGSYAAYCSTGGSCKGTFASTSASGSSVIYDFPKDYDYIENFGLLHNDALTNMYLSNNVTSELTWMENNIPDIKQINYKDDLYNNSEYIDIKKKINEITDKYKASNYDASSLLEDYYKEKMINGNVKDILSLYFNATMKAQTFDDYKDITDKYVFEIENSKLTNNEKESLLASFAVSIQSYYYWLNLEI